MMHQTSTSAESGFGGGGFKAGIVVPRVESEDANIKVIKSNASEVNVSISAENVYTDLERQIASNSAERRKQKTWKPYETTKG